MPTLSEGGRPTPDADAARRAPAEPDAVRARTARQVLLLCIAAIVLSVLGSPQVTRPIERYALGDYTSYAIRSPYDLAIVDEEATRQQRAAAAAAAPVVAHLDRRVAAALQARMGSALAPIEQALTAVEAADAAAAVPRNRSAAAEAARARQRATARRDAVDAVAGDVELRLGQTLPTAIRDALSSRDVLAAMRASFDRLVADTYRLPVVADAASIRSLAGDTIAAGLPLHVVLVDADGREERVDDLSRLAVLADVRASLGDRAERLKGGLTSGTAAWLATIASAWLRPSVVADATATGQRRDTAAQAVLPVSLTFRRNQLIVGEGQPVTRQTLLALEALRQQRLDVGVWRRTGARAGVLLGLLLVAYWAGWYRRRHVAVPPGQFPYLLTSLLFTAVAFRVWLELAGSLSNRYPGIPETAMVLAFPATAAAMYARVVLPFPAAATYFVLQSLCLGLLWQLDLAYVIHLLVSAAIGTRLVARCSGRDCVMRAGIVTGLLVGPVAACLALLGDTTGATVLWTTAGAMAGCVLSGLSMLAVGPLFEWVFGHMTRIRLVELMNYQHPLLRRITELTPGTFQHSVTIGLLADAAATAIDADGLLARVGALYHDAGKTEQPEYFVENQRGVNPHDTLAPLESARAIIAHVPAGVRLVREYGLGERVADFVREHHGTSTVKYFLNRAAQAGASPDPADFAYPGPMPRSRETGILMIADQVEATARAMDAPTEDDLRAMVRATIERIVGDHQLDECPLTQQDLSAIREAFVQVLAGVHHRRIKYPGVSLTPTAAR